ncbi:MAG: beta-propeller fold lactonase family protein [Bacteroidota bacterium]
MFSDDFNGSNTAADIYLTPEGKFVFVANRDSNHIVVFRRDSLTGALTYTGVELDVPLAVCVTKMAVE